MAAYQYNPTGNPLMTKFLSLFALVFLIACLPETGNSIDIDNIQIVEGEIGGKKYFVPDAYLFPLTTQVGPESMYLQVHYPTFVPLTETTEEMWKKGEMWKSFRLLISHMPQPKTDFHEFSIEMTKGKAATKLVGNEYGLTHKTQREDLNTPSLWQLQDVWFEEENGKYLSYITCTEKILETDNPICTLNFRTDANLSYKITFNKHILPHWNEIKTSSIALVESFKSPESAKNYLTYRVHKSIKKPRED